MAPAAGWNYLGADSAFVEAGVKIIPLSSVTAGSGASASTQPL